MNIGPTFPPSAPAVVFTATFPGIYSFVIVGSGLGGSQAYVNGAGVNNVQQVSGGTAGSSVVQLAFSAYLAQGDVISYEGPAAEMFGVRLGNEL
jgi:hypothetical protein